MTMRLKKEYENAKSSSEILQRRFKLVRLAIQEDSGLVRAIDKLALLKPYGIKLTDLEIEAGKDLTVEGLAEDPAVFGKYVEMINSEKEMFLNARLERMFSSGVGNVRNFTIKAGIVSREGMD